MAQFEILEWNRKTSRRCRIDDDHSVVVVWDWTRRWSTILILLATVVALGVSDRSKTMRAIKKTDSSFIDGQRIYYDYLRPHSALDGKTPAQAVGIELGLVDDRWSSLIKKVAKERQESS